MEEEEYGIFAYEDEPRDLEELENPETEILGERNDLSATWQVQLHLTRETTGEPEYEAENNPEYEDTEQATLDTGVTPERPNSQISDYNTSAGLASD